MQRRLYFKPVFYPTQSHLVVEHLGITLLVADDPILNIITFGNGFHRDPGAPFGTTVVVKTLRTFPQFDFVAAH